MIGCNGRWHFFTGAGIVNNNFKIMFTVNFIVYVSLHRFCFVYLPRVFFGRCWCIADKSPLKCEVISWFTVLILLLLVLMFISFWSCFPKNPFTFCVKIRQPYCLLSLAIFLCHLEVSGPLSDFCLFSRCYIFKSYKLISWPHYPHCFGLGSVVKLVK